MTRPPHAASSVVGYASDTASAVAKVEPNSNRSRETGRPYHDMWLVSRSESWTLHWDGGRGDVDGGGYGGRGGGGGGGWGRGGRDGGVSARKTYLRRVSNGVTCTIPSIHAMALTWPLCQWIKSHWQENESWLSTGTDFKYISLPNNNGIHSCFLNPFTMQII